ncbi:hypothetical protein niasHT_001690 [Heterodera trifolii]|uniref:Uncharacterized protein n=1 Tax=Heterodera trifolii TaxID=157864 RepID=A0ABD2M4C7_9BILA
MDAEKENGAMENANDGNGSNASVGIGTKIKRIVTAGLLFTSLATGGADAIQRSNVQGGNATGLLHPQMPNRAMRESSLPTRTRRVMVNRRIFNDKNIAANIATTKKEMESVPFFKAGYRLHNRIIDLGVFIEAPAA